jgi:hypothetical protein
LPMGVASEPDYLMSLSRKACRNRRSDQARCSGYQNPHRGVPRLAHAISRFKQPGPHDGVPGGLRLKGWRRGWLTNEPRPQR